MAEFINTLVVDDEERICRFLEETLRRDGHVVTIASNGDKALKILRENRFDAAILDLNLGGRIDGIRILEAIRWRWPDTAVVILTAHGSLESAMVAIQEGIDGYLLKPATPKEVRHAVRDALKRRQRLSISAEETKPAHILESGPFSVNLESHVATFEGQRLDLTPHDFKLLVHLMRNAPQVIDPVELVEVVRGYQPDHLQEARQIIKWYVHRLRHAVEPDPSDPRHIINVRGVGYRFKG